MYVYPPFPPTPFASSVILLPFVLVNEEVELFTFNVPVSGVIGFVTFTVILFVATVAPVLSFTVTANCFVPEYLKLYVYSALFPKSLFLF